MASRATVRPSPMTVPRDVVSEPSACSTSSLDCVGGTASSASPANVARPTGSRAEARRGTRSLPPRRPRAGSERRRSLPSNPRRPSRGRWSGDVSVKLNRKPVNARTRQPTAASSGTIGRTFRHLDRRRRMPGAGRRPRDGVGTETAQVDDDQQDHDHQHDDEHGRHLGDNLARPSSPGVRSAMNRTIDALTAGRDLAGYVRKRARP